MTESQPEVVRLGGPLAGRLLSLGAAGATVAGTTALPFYAVASMPSQVWPAGNCLLCAGGVPPTSPFSGG